METFYAPTFIDESRSRRGKPTGKLRGFVMTRSFYKGSNGKIKSNRGVIPFSWEEDTDEAKAEALSKVITGKKEMPELDENPPLTWVPTNYKLTI